MTQWLRLARGHPSQGDDMPGGAKLIKLLLNAAEKKNIPIYHEHKAVQLLTGPMKEVIGLKSLTNTGYVDFIAKSGGWVSRLTLRGTRYTTGENIYLALHLFANMVNKDQFHSGLIVSETHVNPADVLNTMQGTVVRTNDKR